MRKIGKQAAAYICAAAMVVTALPAAPAITSNAAVLPGLTDLGRQVALRDVY